jgi:hypothetical protein
LNPIVSAVLQALPCFFPAGFRLFHTGLSEPAGLVSDVAVGLFLYSIIRIAGSWLRAMLLLLWAVFQILSMELLAHMQRLPSLQDLLYLFDIDFLTNSVAGFHLTYPLYVLGFVLAVGVAAFCPVRRFSLKVSALISAIALSCMFVLLLVHHPASRGGNSHSIASRYNPLHWLVAEAFSAPFVAESYSLPKKDLPVSLRTFDLDGRRLIDGGRAKNVLVVILEGVSGIYIPEIRQKMQISADIFQMRELAQSTGEAMLVADFVTHSHQTIRGLYALHCGDFSKFSFATPKGLELQNSPERAAQCLPGWMSRYGWETHYLQGAGLQFMNKDRVMPAMGFQQVHGVEWFTERTDFDFIWGTTDEDFFVGARQYISELEKEGKPWLLSLLTVGTHQPFAVTEEMAEQHGSRKIAAIAGLDKAVAGFINGLRRDGVLDDTMVIITSDESHGAEGADWYSSWGFAIVLAPEQAQLPRQKAGNYGLVDLQVSVLDYFDLPVPPDIIGRSMFREYSSLRDMVSYTGGKLRWQTSDNMLLECGRDGSCLKMKSASIIGSRPQEYDEDTEGWAERSFQLALTLDNGLRLQTEQQVLQFAAGEIRKLPAKIRNEWTDNLIGAQYLDFPEKSKVSVDIMVKAVTAEEDGIQLKLTLRQFEEEVQTIDYPEFPVLHAGEECRIRFAFDNVEARQAFSFHLVGEGRDTSIEFRKFEVIIEKNEG